MAKPELLFHVKLGRLQRTLGIRKYEAVGILECVWHHCYQCIDAGVGTAADLAWIVDWPAAAADQLAAALAACGLIDPDPARPGEWAVHDLWVHAPRYARQRRARAEVPSEQDSNLVRSSSVPHQKNTREEEQRLAPLSHPVDPCGKPRAAPEAVEPVNPRVLGRLCYELGLEDCQTWADAADALKGQAARYRVPYTGAAVTRALTTVGYARAGSPLAALVRARGT